jgi:predicted RNase H-like HicB family nuclease
MKKKIMDYPVIVRSDKRTGTNAKCYSAYCPRLEVYADGDTVEEAVKEIKKSIELAVEVNKSYDYEETILTSVRLAF